MGPYISYPIAFTIDLFVMNDVHIVCDKHELMIKLKKNE